MKKFKNVALVIALMIVMTLCAAGCGGCGKKNLNTIDKNTIYRENVIEVGFPQDFEVNSIDIRNGKMAAIGYVTDENYDSTSYLISCNIDGSDVKTKIFDNNTYIEDVLVTYSGKYIVKMSSYSSEEIDGEFYYSNSYCMYVYDENLNEEACIDLMKEFDVSWASSSIVLPDGKIVLNVYDSILVLDDKLNFINKLENDKQISGFYTLRDGSLVASYWKQSGGSGYSRYNLNNGELGEEIVIPDFNYEMNVLQGSAYDFILADAQQVYGFNVGDASLTPLMNYINSDLSVTGFRKLVALSDNSFVGFYYDWLYSDYNCIIARYTKVNPEDVVEKKLISLGCIYMNDTVRRNVIEFNRASEEYRIIVKDYSQYNTDEDYWAGTKRLNSDIASGQAPDIIVASDPSTIKNYASKGLFVDLYKYLNTDKDVDKNDLFPNLLEACSIDGKLYTLAPMFYVETVIGKTSKLGNRTGWTFKEMEDFEKTLPDGTTLFSGTTRDEFVSMVLSVNADSYIDAASGKCHFDSEEFIALLEYAKKLPDNIEYIYAEDFDYSEYEARYRNDKAILKPTSFGDFSIITYEERNQFGEPVTFVGYPSSDGNGSAIVFYQTYAISSLCVNPDGAWSFIKYFVTPEYQETVEYGIPASMKRFDEMGLEAQKEPEPVDDSEYGGFGYKGIMIDDFYWRQDPITADDFARVKNFILTVNKSSGTYSDIETIISEEAQAFYEGQKSAEEVAKIIQSRATIYVNEKQ